MITYLPVIKILHAGKTVQSQWKTAWWFFRKLPVKLPSAGMLNHVWLFPTPWTVTHQAPLSMQFSRQEYCSGLPFPTPGDLPKPGIKPASLTLAGEFFITALPGKFQITL